MVDITASPDNLIRDEELGSSNKVSPDQNRKTFVPNSKLVNKQNENENELRNLYNMTTMDQREDSNHNDKFDR